MDKQQHKKLQALIPAYALDSLDADERILVEEHIASCPACQTELRAFQGVADLLPLAAPDAQPSPALRRILISQVSQSRAPRHKASLLERLGASVAVPVWQLAAFALAATVFFAALLFLNLNEPSHLTQIVLNPSIQSTGAMGHILLFDEGQRGTLIVDNLPFLDSEHQYQLWLIDKNEKRISGGLFSVPADGYQSIVIYSPQPLDSYASFGITVEPWGGSDGPTTAPVLVSD